VEEAKRQGCKRQRGARHTEGRKRGKRMKKQMLDASAVI
jgi:hypothetical protein